MKTNEKIGQYTFYIESTACDFMGKAPLPYLCNFLLKAADHHADGFGFGYESMHQNNSAWVLSRLGVYMQTYPKHDEQIRVETWVKSVEKYFSHRCFAIYAENGQGIGYAQSIWAAIDLGTRRPVNITDINSEIVNYIYSEKDIPHPKIGKIPSAETENPILYKPRYSDIDLNKHFNSVKYIEKILDIFDVTQYEQHQVSHFEIVYQSEGLPSATFSLHKKEIENRFIVEIKNENTASSLCRALFAFENI